MGWTNRKNLVRLLARHVVGEGGAILLTGSGQLDAGHDGDGRVEYRQADCQLRNVSIKARAYLGAVGRKSGAVEPRNRVGRGWWERMAGRGHESARRKKGETTKIWPWRRRRGAQDTSEGDGNRVGRGRGGRRVGGTRVERKLEGGWGEDGMERIDVQPRAGLSVCCCWLLLWCGGGQKENAAARMGVVKKEKRQATRGWGPQLRGGSARGKARPRFGRRFRDGLDDLQGQMVIFLMGCAPSPFAMMESTER